MIGSINCQLAQTQRFAFHHKTAHFTPLASDFNHCHTRFSNVLPHLGLDQGFFDFSLYKYVLRPSDLPFSPTHHLVSPSAVNNVYLFSNSDNMKLPSRLRGRSAATSSEKADSKTSSPASVNATNGHFQDDATQHQNQKGDLVDVEQQSSGQNAAKKSVYQSLGWLDRLLALWILLAIIIGILLGNYVESVGPALQRGKFVQVSVPIG